MPAKDKFAVKIIRTINLIQFCIQCEYLVNAVFIKEISNFCELGGEEQSRVRVSFEPFGQSMRGSTYVPRLANTIDSAWRVSIELHRKKETTL